MRALGAICLTASLVLGGCGSNRSSSQPPRADPAAECERSGFTRGTPFFDRCVENLRQISAPGTAATDTAPLLRTRGAAQGAFFTRVRDLCEKRFPGRAVFTSTPDDPMARASLVMHVATCTGEEIRVPFLVDGDRSRTWVITLHPGAMQLKHDHRHPDGTPDEITMYGGWAAAGGTGLRQRFPADSQTAVLIPAAATNVWTLEFDEGKGQFIYDLERDGRPRFRAVFDLRAPLPPDR